MSDEPPYHVSSQVKKWRFVCPEEEHKDWYAWDGVFSCRTCKRLRDQGESIPNTVYSELLDTKTGDRVDRADLLIEKDTARQTSSRSD